MRPFLLLALIPAALCAAPALQIVKPVVSQIEGGEADAAGFEHTAGETVFFTCRVAGYAKSPDQKVHIAYTVQTLDPRGAPVMETYKNAVLEEVLPQDKDWEPKIETEINLPPLVPAGEFKIVVKAEDVIGGVTAELPVTFKVRGTRMDVSDKLVVRNLGFYRGEDDAQPLARPIFHNGGALWVKFDLTGYKYGPNNKSDVTYTVSILGAGEKVLKAFDPQTDRTEGVYPKPWVPCSVGIPLQKVQVGEYTIVIHAKDATGNQSAEARRSFTVE